ncbi:hypothetical protein N7539_009183 [Penicillium diatomitis]|uniref:Uncharacterized protein n=1 Tax=Penicillium diatomitis TaxID=2819901 RepID=A0A9X0BJG9_9EURO|nr:uncharacterized protein N7539_009183 [Penicillium diatomitis]KAJ5469565.1 hypothetical protein N7539_009183 [Penicillium diatomitis]
MNLVLGRLHSSRLRSRPAQLQAAGCSGGPDRVDPADRGAALASTSKKSPLPRATPPDFLGKGVSSVHWVVRIAHGVYWDSVRVAFRAVEDSFRWTGLDGSGSTGPVYRHEE